MPGQTRNKGISLLKLQEARSQPNVYRSKMIERLEVGGKISSGLERGKPGVSLETEAGCPAS